MNKTLTDIAEEIKDTNKKVQLIYAFNGTGKTRLSREFREVMRASRYQGDNQGEEALPVFNMLYYNALTEDLFYWDNDFNGEPASVLKIHPNRFTDWILNDQGQDQNIIAHFQRYTHNKLTPRFNEAYETAASGGSKKRINPFSEITFSLERGDDSGTNHLKISKGQESLFIWSVFYALLAQVIDVVNVAEKDERETDLFDALEYVFIDDPVSSLDENHLIQLAVDLAQLIKSDKSGQLRYVVTTHSPLFYNVLFNELKSSQNYILSYDEVQGHEIRSVQGDSNRSFSYHLYIKKLIEEAISNNTIERYHFMLLRNLYEKTASFLGYKKWSALLPDNQEAYSKRVMQFYSHRTLSNEEVAEPTEQEKQTVKYLLNHLVDNYRFYTEER